MARIQWPKSSRQIRTAEPQRGLPNFSDAEMNAIMRAATGLSPEKRTIFIERVAAFLRTSGVGGIDAAINHALKGLVQERIAVTEE